MTVGCSVIWLARASRVLADSSSRPWLMVAGMQGACGWAGLGGWETLTGGPGQEVKGPVPQAPWLILAIARLWFDEIIAGFGLGGTIAALDGIVDILGKGRDVPAICVDIGSWF